MHDTSQAKRVDAVLREDELMKSPMLPEQHHQAVQRAMELGRGGDPAALPNWSGC
jgi:hypothetical protein